MLTPIVYLAIVFSLSDGLTTYHNGEVLPLSLPSKCNSVEYYDVLQFRCISCDVVASFLVPSKDGYSCVCNDRSKVVAWNGSTSFPICQVCEDNEIPTADQRNCITCPIQNTSPTNDSLCEHFLCPNNSIFVDTGINGAVLDRIECIECPKLSRPSASGSECKSCGGMYEELCCSAEPCPSADILNWPTDDATYTIAYAARKLVSPLFKTRMRKAIFLCQRRDRKACQEVGNLCVLFGYNDEEPSSPCVLFRSAKRIPGTLGISPLPWIYYGDGDAPAVLSRRRISTSYSLNPSSHSGALNLTGAFYDVDGTFLRMESVKGSDLQICPGPSAVTDRSFVFLTPYKYSCCMSARQLLKNRNTEFIDLFLSAQDETGDVLHAVPVLIRNMPENMEEDRTQWTLVRRFFLLDNVTTPDIVRVASQVTLKIRLQGRQHVGKIYVPLLVVEYTEVTSEQVSNGTNIFFQFQVVYEMTGSFYRTIEVAMGSVSGLAVLWAGIRTWSHSKRSSRVTVDLNTLAHFILFSSNCLAYVFFYVVFIASVTVFVFYKGQRSAYVVLPTSHEEDLIHVYVTIAIVLKVGEILYLIYRQVTVDIFLIDWERPRGGSDHPISIWRTYFVANEWNEIQTNRKINIYLHLLLTTLILQVMGVENWSSADPQLHLTSPHPSSHFNYTCRFAVGGLVFLSVYTVQWLFMVTIYERYAHNPIHEFVDLCSMANISVFILTHERFGYYIHGRSAHGFADTDLLSIVTQLCREEEDLVGSRGLIPGTEQQTFEMMVPSTLREHYNKVMAPINSVPRRMRTSRGKCTNKEAVERSVNGYHSMNRFLSAFLDHALKDLDYEVREKMFAESLLAVEFMDSSDKGILFTDNGQSFDQVLWYGRESMLFSFDLFLFSFVQLTSESFLLAASITAIVGFVLAKLRQFGGHHNLAKKTLTDDRFLL